MNGIKVMLAISGLSAAIALGTTGASVVQAATSTCRVRNLTQGTAGASFQVMVTAARDGDRLTLRGACRGNVRIDKEVLVRGIGDAPAIIGNGRGSLVHVLERARVVLVGLSIRGGGTGLLNAGSVKLKDVRVEGNAVSDEDGGGIFNLGTMTIIASSIVGNSTDAAASGAGIYNRGTMTVVDSAIADNEATFFSSGGGIYNEGTLALVRSVVRGNTSEEGGGGIYNEGTLTLEDTLVSDNTDVGAGGGIYNDTYSEHPGTVTFEGTSTVIGNAPDDCYGTTACPGVPPVGPAGPCAPQAASPSPALSPDPSQAPETPLGPPSPDDRPTSSLAPDPCASPGASPPMAPDSSPPVPEGSPPPDAG